MTLDNCCAVTQPMGVDVQNDNVCAVDPSADSPGGVPLDLEKIRAAQSNDDSIKVVTELLRAGITLAEIDVRQYPEEARQLFGQWESLVVHDQVLYRRFYHTDGTTKFLQVVLPGTLRKPFVEQLHAELGHFGQSKTAIAVSRRAYFPGWRSFTHLVVRNCAVCNKSQRGRQTPSRLHSDL